MKIKTLLSLTIALLVTLLVSCDDNLNSVGSSIQPDGDDIYVYTDTVVITAKTVSMKDSVYARTEAPLLGEYNDQIFGKIKSDYLCELYCPENTSFNSKTISIDSTSLNLMAYTYTGDTISPIGISAYQVVNPLKANFFTNVDPKKYCDMTKALGHGLFSVKDVAIDATFGLKNFKINLDNALGNAFYNEWKTSKGGTFKNSETLKEFFKGFYVTTNFGSAGLLNIRTSIFKIHYSYTGRNKANTADSTRTDILTLPFTPEVIQLNRVQNNIPQQLFENGDTRTYIKSPAGVCTELTIPLKEIMNKAEQTGGKNNKINAANFKLKGFTEEESKMSTGRSSYLLFVNKDSLTDFFLKKKMPDLKTSFILELGGDNSYNFNYGNIQSYVSNNIANLINHYADFYKDSASIPDLKYVVIPISVLIKEQQTQSGTYIKVFSEVYNQMYPTSSILRTDKDNMKMSLIFSNYTKNKSGN